MILTFDAHDRAILQFASAGVCVALTPAELGFELEAWMCWDFTADRTLQVNETIVDGCPGSGDGAYPDPQQPELRAGGYCFQVNAGTGRPALLLM